MSLIIGVQRSISLCMKRVKLGRGHGRSLDRILLNLPLHLRPIHGLDDFVIDAIDHVRRKPRRPR